MAQDSKVNPTEALLAAARARKLRDVIDAVKAGADRTATDEEGNTALHLAAISGFRKTVQYLIEQKFTVDPTNEAGLTPLYYAVSGGFAGIAADLISAGANIHHASPKLSETLLMTAAYRNAPKLVAKLLKHGAQIDAQDANGATALMRAAGQNNTECMILLMDAGANPQLTSNTGRTAQDFAKRTRAAEAIALLDSYIPTTAVTLAKKTA